MEQIIMNASIISAIILAFVGIVKLPFKKFKEKHPNWFKAVFCLLSTILSVIGAIITQLYIIGGELVSINSFVLVLMTLGTVTFSYNMYEGIGLKILLKVVVSKLKELFSTYSESKLVKIIGTVGIEKLNELDARIKEEQAKINVANTEKVEVKVEEVK